MSESRSPTTASDPLAKRYNSMAVLAGLIFVLLWAYWNSLTRLADTFWENPKYSNGYLVPLFTLALLWLRRDVSIVISPRLTGIGVGLLAVGIAIPFVFQERVLSTHLLSAEALSFIRGTGIALAIIGAGIVVGGLPTEDVSSSARLAGIGLLAGGLLIRLASTWWPTPSPELASFVPCLAGIFLMIGGWPTLKWAGPAVAFLIFMFPLPGFLDATLLVKMQHWATVCSCYALQTIGIACYNEGNTIRIGETSIGIVEACSGLRMLTMFIAISVAITMVTNRPIWERVVIILSSIPIALFVNITRITVTGILYMIAADPNNSLGITEKLAHDVFHDLAGWVMMPLALGMMYIEFQILSHLVIEDIPAGGIPVGLDIRRPRRGSVIGS